jgi:hypothetical protein
VRKKLAVPWKPWTGAARVYLVVVVEGAAGRVGRRRSIRVVLWVDTPGQVSNRDGQISVFI